MYPNLYFAFLDLLGWDLPALKLINSFGFFVALAFLATHALLKGELKRLAALGHFKAQTTTVTVGMPPHPLDLGLQAILGFVLGDILETNLRRALSLSAGTTDSNISVSAIGPGATVLTVMPSGAACL